jgi:hypothetical protein
VNPEKESIQNKFMMQVLSSMKWKWQEQEQEYNGITLFLLTLEVTAII